jgi:hypothetical protein
MNRKHSPPEQYVNPNSFVICVDVQTQKVQDTEMKQNNKTRPTEAVKAVAGSGERGGAS